MDLQMAGQLDLAEQLYRSILQAQPAHAVANHCLGMLQVQLRRPADGLPFLLSALDAHPEIPDYWLGYLEALLQSDQIDAAKEALTLARQHGLSGKAVDEFAQRLSAATQAATPQHHPEPPPLAAAPQPHSEAPRPGPPRPGAPRPRLPRRKDSRAVRKQADALTLLIAQKRIAEALVLARAMTERFPQHGLGWKQLGALLWWQGSFEEAFIPMQDSVRLSPQDAEAHNNFGMALLKLRRVDEAVSHFRTAIEIDPRCAAAHYHLGMTHLEEHRFAEAETSLRTAVSLRPDYLDAEIKPVHSDLLFLSSHNPALHAESLFAEHRRFGESVEIPLRELRPRHSNTPEPERRLRIGFVSGDFRDHSVAMFMEPVLTRLIRRPALELYAYYNYDSEDRVTARLRESFNHWHPILALSDLELASRIIEDRIDILIDLSGHTAGNRLRTFARKPAPVQVSWLGYPGTTGLQSLDYYIADCHWLPPGRFDHLFSEKLAYLPDRWAFEPHVDAPPVGALPALSTGRLTLGSFHRLSKINPATIRLWSELLLALPQARMLFVGIAPGSQQKILIEQFGAQGVAAERLTFHGRCSMGLYLALHHQVDFCLDTRPYAGATTTMHSLSMGVPTLTVAGATSWARAGAGILRNAGLDGFIAVDDAGFVEKGVYWANHLAELAQIRAELRPRLAQSPGGQPDLIAAHLEGALRHMWRRWCAGLSAESFHSSGLESLPQSREAQLLERDGALLGLMAQRRFTEALALARAMTEQFPEHGLGWKIFGALLWSEGYADEALTAMHAATRLMPHDAEAHSNLGISFAAVKRFDDAERLLRAALAIDPSFTAAHYRLGMYYEVQARYEEAEASLRTAITLRSGPLTVDDEQGYSNLLYVISHNPNIDAESLFAEHRGFGECFETPLRGSWPRHSNSPDAKRRLQIGFVSGDFRDHSVATFMEPVLVRLMPRPGLELHAYYNNPSEDRVTARLRGYFPHWHPVSTLSNVELAQKIIDDGIDILIDLSGQTAANRLPAFALKPAPVQASWLGYPGTTGLQSIDYYFADRLWLPPGQYDHLFTEKLVYLPDRWAFEPHASAPAAGALPALETGRMTFGSFHRLGKVNSSSIRLWSELLLALPETTLLVAGISLDGQQKPLIEQFAARGITAERLTFHGRCNIDAYLALHHKVDIALDTHPYAGATTTMHSLSMGVPTLTVAGTSSGARAGAGILRHAGLEGFIAANHADFVDKGIYWSNHLAELAVVRAGMRRRLTLSPGGQPELIAAHLEGALRHMWRRWCAGQPAESFHSSATGALP
jgi:predicted O-linked N-acetylglucosamine transferase (SPINDLY family)/Flp pilus assembly protein TadD